VTDDLAAAWDELHDAKPDDRPAELRRRPQAVGPVRLSPARACTASHRSREWTAIAPSSVEVVV